MLYTLPRACLPTPLTTNLPACLPAISPAPCCSGFYAWFRTFDVNGWRRRSSEPTFSGDSAEGPSSAARFDVAAAIEAWVPPKF